MRSPWVDIRDTLLVTAACVVAGPLVLMPYNVGLPLVALALSWLTYRRGVPVAAGAAVIAGLALGVAFANPAEGVLVTAVMLLAGPWAASAIRRRSAWQVFAVLTLATLAAMVAVIAVEQAAVGSTILVFVHEVAKQTADTVRAQAVAMGASSATAASEVSAIRAMIEQVLPSVLVLMTGIASLLAVYGVGWVARRAGEEVRALPPLEQLDLSFHLTWGVVAGLALLAAARFAGGDGSWAGALGWNVMVLMRGALFLQGLAVFAGLYRRAKIGRIGRLIGYVFLVITEVITTVIVPIGLVSITGLIDLWVNIRKLPRRGAEPPKDSLEAPLGGA